MYKRRFNIRAVMRWIGDAVKPFSKGTLFELADDGFYSPVAQLIA